MKISLELKNAFLALLFIGCALGYAERTGGQSTDPKGGAAKMVVRNHSGYTLDITVGTEVKHNVLHLGTTEFVSTNKYVQPYLVKVKVRPFDVNPFNSKTGNSSALEFTNPDSMDGYQTSVQKTTLEIPEGTFFDSKQTSAEAQLYCQYEWKDGYWVVTIKKA